MTNEELWQAVLAQIQLNISQANFATWFRSTRVLNKKGGQVIVSVPNNFAKEWLENKYNKLILKILHSLEGTIKEVNYTVARSGLKVTPHSSIFISKTDQLDFQEFKINKETNLNPRYSFENFVVGSFNEMAQAAASAIVKEPGTAYNPFYVYGGVGLGKTHLIQAIGNEIIKNSPKKKIQYIPSAKFISEVVNSIRNHKIEDLKITYRKVDVLIIDDIQFLAGKEKTQEEFFHIFNALYEKNKQIILSSDKIPKAISNLEERLRSRFEGGMIADISLPDTETRIAILKTKMAEQKIDLPKEVIDYAATNIRKNIRELEGALNRLIIYQKLNNKPPTVEVAKHLLKNVIIKPMRAINLRKILQVVAEFYDLKEKDILDISRKKEIVFPRQVAMYVSRKELKCSFPLIGRKFGGKDHTTAIYAYKKIKKEVEKNESFADEIGLIKERIYSG